MADKIVLIRDGGSKEVDDAIHRVLLKSINEIAEAYEAGTLDKRTIMNARRLLPGQYSMTLERPKEAA